ncbi:MAG: hypothetical protein SFU27_06550 [Thermonemataceae bacterium]|nr:hypothetical protein [Thermonemataceae bacterium]
MRKIQAQLMYYYHWKPKEIQALSLPELCEAWQNLLWAREQEAKTREHL